MIANQLVSLLQQINTVSDIQFVDFDLVKKFFNGKDQTRITFAQKTVFTVSLQGSAESAAFCPPVAHRDLDCLGVLQVITLADYTIKQETASSPDVLGSQVHVTEWEMHPMKIQEPAP